MNLSSMATLRVFARNIGPPLYRRRLLGIRSFAVSLSPPSKAIVYEQHGPPDQVTKLIEVPPKELKENDVCVKMLAAPINPSDINRIQGVYPVRPLIPAIGGYEGVGEVHAIGSAVTSLSIGDWVIPSPPSSGTWQTYMVNEASTWHKVSKNVPMEYAATITVNPLTALLMLREFTKLKADDSVVQNGATSIVGQCIIQLAKLQGVKSINIIRDRAGSEEAKEKLKRLGADMVFTESQLNVKNVKSLLVISSGYIKEIYNLLHTLVNAPICNILYPSSKSEHFNHGCVHFEGVGFALSNLFGAIEDSFFSLNGFTV